MLSHDEALALVNKCLQRFDPTNDPNLGWGADDEQMWSANNLQPSRLIELSDHFDIEVDLIRTLSPAQIFSLDGAYWMDGDHPVPFEVEQSIADRHAKIIKAGGIIPYLEQYIEEKHRPKPKPFSLLGSSPLR